MDGLVLPFLELGPFQGEEWMVIKPHLSLLVVCGSNQRGPREIYSLK